MLEIEYLFEKPSPKFNKILSIPLHTIWTKNPTAVLVPLIKDSTVLLPVSLMTNSWTIYRSLKKPILLVIYSTTS